MPLQLMNQTKYQEWDEYVLSHPDGTIFHTTRWLKNFRGELKVLVQRKKKRIVGGLAYVINCKYRQKGIHNPPYTPFSGPLFGDIVSERHFNSITKYYEFIRELTSELRYGHVEFMLPSTTCNILPYKWAGFIEELHVTYKIAAQSTENYLHLVNSNKRREIEKFNPLVEKGELVVDQQPDIDEILKLQSLTGERSDFDPRTEELKSALEGSREHTYFIALRSQKEGVFSCGAFVYDHKKVYNLINASKRIDHPVYKNANVYLLYKAICEAFDRGLEFDFEGSTIPGVERFYRMLGGEQHQRVRVQKSRSSYYFLLRMLKQWKAKRK